MKIKTIRFSGLSNESHYQFLDIVKSLLVKFPNVKSLVTTLFPTYSNLLDLLKKLVSAKRKSGYTPLLAKTDQRIDYTITAIRAAISYALHSSNPLTVEAAQALFDRMKSFGNIRKKAYGSESSAVQLRLIDFQGIYSPQVVTVGISGLVSELSAAEASFTQLFEQRNTELAGRPQEDIKDVFRNIDNIYHEMTACFENDMVMHGEGVCGVFAGELNKEVKYYNEHSHHRTKTDIANAVFEPIAAQLFTGWPITLLPVGFIYDEDMNMIKLTFSVDFTVSYRNNTDVGTAEMIIRGTGAYKGEKILLFTIVEEVNK
jgi:hypothetical protein